MKIIVSLLVAASLLAATVAPTLATGDWYDTRTRADLWRPELRPRANGQDTQEMLWGERR